MDKVAVVPSLAGFPTRGEKEISYNVWVAGEVGLGEPVVGGRAPRMSLLYAGVGRSAVGGCAPLRPAGRHGEGQVPYPGWKISLGSGFPA